MVKMKKRLTSLVLMFVLITSTFVLAEEDPCAGFWGTISCFLWGNPQARATGQGWFERGG